MFFKQLILFFSFGLVSVFYLSLTKHSPNIVNMGVFSTDSSPKNLANFSLAQAKPQENSTSNTRPAPPPRIPPNRVKPGGGLNFARQSCGENSASLTALVPVDNPVLTTQPYPSFLFYIPDAPTAISHGEFAIFSADEKQQIYSTTVNFERTPGIIKIDIPPLEQYALEEATYYHWYFRVYCQDSMDVRQSLDVDGWIQRIALTPTIESQIEARSPDVWYDAIAFTAENLITTPSSLLVSQRWVELLQHIDLEYLVNYPIIDVSQKSTTKTKIEE